MDTNKITQMIRIAKMHYELNRTQLEVAKRDKQGHCQPGF